MCVLFCIYIYIYIYMYVYVDTGRRQSPSHPERATAVQKRLQGVRLGVKSGPAGDSPSHTGSGRTSGRFRATSGFKME